MPSFNNDELNLVIAEVERWAQARPDIIGLALVGSYARGNAQSDSDIDLIVLTSTPEAYRNDTAWLAEINWQIIAATIADWRDEDYGVVWSRHLFLADKREIEIGFGDRSWATTDPVDAATRKVINNGCRIIYDPEALINNFLTQISRR
jgi:uncharacterized protein